MILSEQEAKTKWCPMARVGYVGVGIVAVNRLEERPKGIDWPTANTRCHASGCMAWSEPVYGSGKGYCGLAGK